MKKGSEFERLEATWNQVKTDCEHPEKLYEWKLVCQNFHSRNKYMEFCLKN